jgi:hypothetical protein
MFSTIRACSVAEDLDNKIEKITDILKEQNRINKSIIEVLQLREDPMYRKEVTDCNLKSIGTNTIKEKEK